MKKEAEKNTRISEKIEKTTHLVLEILESEKITYSELQTLQWYVGIKFQERAHL